MQRPQTEPVTLDDVVITEELSRRLPSSPNLQAENQALHTLARQMANQPETMLQSLADIALELCQAGTAGVSLLEIIPNGEEIFRWNVLAGTLAQYVGGTTPRNFSPCGTTLERGTPQLFSHPDRYFTYFQEANTPIIEGLVLPLMADNQVLGTIWIMSHDEQRHFNSEDVRIMASLADFTATALLLNQRQTQELLAANATLEAEIAERKQTEAQLGQTQRRLELSLTGANLGTWTYHVGADEFWADDRANQMHGHEPDEVHTFAEAGANIHPEDRDQAQAAFAQVIQDRAKLQIEYRVVWRDGSIHWIASYAEFVSTGDSLRDGTEQNDGMFYGVVQDITDRLRLEGEQQAALRERNQAEAALRESEERLRVIIENLPGGAAFVVDHNLRYLLAEGEALSAAGFKPEDLVGKTIFEAMPPELTPQYETLYRQALAGEPFEHEHDAHDRSYVSRGTPLHSADGVVYAVLAVSYDITDRKRSEEQLRHVAKLDAFHVTLSAALRSLTDPVQIQAEACRLLGEHLGVDRAYYVEVNEAESYARVNQDYLRGDSPSLVGIFRLADYGWTVPLLQRGETIIVADAENSDIIPEGDRVAMVAVKIAAHITTPLVKTGALAGALCVTESEPRQWTESEVELVRETGERIWAAIERARAEAALRSSEEQFRLFVTASSDSVYRMSADWREMLSLEGKNLLASTENPSQTWIETYIPPEEQPRVWATIQESIRTKSTFELEHQVIQQDGSIGWTFSRAIPMLSEQGKILEWFGAASDVTDRKQAEANQLQLIREQAAREEERQRAETLAELDRAKTEFFSNVSHEFRTPLTLMLGPLEDTLSKLDDEEDAGTQGCGDVESAVEGFSFLYPLSASSLRKQLQLVHRNGLRLLKLVNTLLDFSRIEAGRMEAIYEPIDLAMFTTELASVFRSAIEQAGLRLIVNCPSLPEPIYVDQEMWEKIVFNLLSNAFKFTLEGEITVRLLATSNHVLLQIQDTGTGISPEHLPHLFERFYQVRGAEARTHEGSGIGLALVHELIRLHGGTIEVSSTVGQGTCFTIALPFGSEHLPSARIQAARTLASTATSAAPYVAEAERWLPTSPPQPTPVASTGGPPATHWLSLERGENLVKVPSEAKGRVSTGVPLIKGDGRGISRGDLGGSPALKTSTSSPARVILVEDNADMHDYLTRILSEYVQVEAVANGAAALAAAQARVPDLVLSDVMMPGLDGFELLQALRADPRTREVPIILLSARAGEESVIEGLDAGADDYLIKPFSAQELVSRVNAHLQMAHLRSEALRQERLISRKKDELLSIVSHELNTPLVAILGWTRFLRANPHTQSMLMKSLETIERNATLQAKLIQDLLDISCITVGKLRLNLQPVELKSVIETAIATVQQTQSTQNAELTCILNPLPTIVQGDPDRLQQIILNLLTNAFKFTSQEGKIEVRLEASETQAQIQVSDTGKGIGPEFLPYVFDSFRQSESSESQGGLGLGLAIAHHLIELHGGTIIAESPGIGQGTTFTITLPLVNSV